jgi:hypothetical protein
VKILFCFLFSLLLGGCGGGEISSDGSGGNNEDTDGGNVHSINTQDIVKFSSLGRELRLPLNDYIEISSSSSNLRLRQFAPILNASRQRYCENYKVDGLNLSFYSTETVGECVYEYTVEADGATSELALIRIVFSAEETGLVRLSETTSIGQTISINLGSAIPDDFYIDKNSFIVLGSGTVQAKELEAHIINYTAGEYEGDAGVSRVLLNLRKGGSDTVIAVTIDIAVSENNINHAPLAFNFRYGDVGTFYPGRQLDYINIPLGETVVIDIAPYFNKGYLDGNDNKIEMKNSKGEYFFDEAGNKINFYMDIDGASTTDIYRRGLYLIEPDKQPVQLIDVYSYNAVVGPVQSVGEFTSTKFSFKSNVPGLNYVTYVLSDHNGGYATGIVAINVGTPVPWKAQLGAAKNTFLAPLEYGLILQQNISHAGASNEDGVNGPIGFSTALYTYNQALALCSSCGLDLPTASDIAGLKVDFPAGLYSSLDKYAVDINARNEKISWPASSYY